MKIKKDKLNFNPTDDYKIDENPKFVFELWLGMTLLFIGIFMYEAKQIVNNICENRSNGTSPW